MEEIIQFITGGSDSFTPSVMVGLIVFCIIFDGLCNMVAAILGGLKR